MNKRGQFSTLRPKTVAGKVKKKISTSFKVAMSIGAVLLAIIIIWGTVWLAQSLPTTLKNVGSTATSHPISPDSVVGQIATVVLGEGSLGSVESLILFLAVFVILFFALSDIISMFSTFSDTTAWVIGFGLALIAGVTNMVSWIAGLLGITAGVGAVGIFLIVFGSICAAVILNLGIGGPARRWRVARQIEINELDAEVGFNKVTAFIKGAKSGTDAAIG